MCFPSVVRCFICISFVFASVLLADDGPADSDVRSNGRASEEKTVKVGTTVVVTDDGAEFGIKDATQVRLARGTKLVVTELRGKWVGGYAILNGKRESGWLRRDQVSANSVEVRPPANESKPPAGTRVFSSKIPAILLHNDDSILWHLEVELGRTSANGKDAVVLFPGIDWSVRPVQQTDEALKQLAADSEAQPILGISLRDTKITDAGLAHLAKVKGLKFVRLLQCWEITDDGLGHLRRIPELNKLQIYNCPKLTEAGLANLAGHPTLQTLGIGLCAQFKDSWLTGLKDLPALKVVQFRHLDALDDAAFSSLAALKDLRSLTISNCKNVTGRGLQKINGSELRALELWSLPLAEDGLEALRSMKNLRYLDLYGCELDKVDATPLAELRQLQFLKLTRTNANDKTLSQLEKLTNLTGLLLYDCKDITDAGMAYLKDLENLEKLQLPTSYGDKKITEAGVLNLAKMTAMRDLTVPSSAWTDKSLSAIKGMTQLRKLAVGGEVTDEGLAVLANMSELTELKLSTAKITDDGLAALGNLTHLKSLELERTNINGSGLRHLENSQLAKLKIWYGKIREGLSHLHHLEDLEAISLENSDAAFSDIEGLHSLRRLRLSRADLTDEGLKSICENLKSLEQLELDECDKITGPGLKHIAGLPNLKELHVGWRKEMRDEHLGFLKSLENLESLTLRGGFFSNLDRGNEISNGLNNLQALTKLRKLDLFRANINDDTVPALMKLTQLAELDVRRGTRYWFVTKKELKEALEKALPNTEIKW